MPRYEYCEAEPAGDDVFTIRDIAASNDDEALAEFKKRQSVNSILQRREIKEWETIAERVVTVQVKGAG